MARTIRHDLSPFLLVTEQVMLVRVAGVALIFLLCFIVGSAKALAQEQDFSTLHRQATDLFHAGRHQEALPVAQHALALAERLNGPAHRDVGAALNDVAVLYTMLGQHAEAEPLLRRALGVREKVLGSEHLDVAETLGNLGALYLRQHRYSEAEPHLARALAIREKVLGPDHLDVGAIVVSLADLYRAQSRHSLAEPRYKRALAITEKALGPDHPDMGALLTSQAELYRSQGRYAEAESPYKRAVVIAERSLGPDHPDVGTALKNLGDLYHAQGRYADAEPLFLRVTTIYTKALGPEHAWVGTALNSLAGLYRAQGRYPEAELLFNRALNIFETTLGPTHRYVGDTLNNLAELYRSQGRYADAEPLYKRAIDITEKAAGRDHPTVAASLNNLALLYMNQGRYSEAELLLKQATGLVENALGPSHPNVGTALDNLAQLYHHQDRYTEAEPLYKRSLAIAEEALGPHHRSVGNSLNNLSGLYEKQGRYAEAEPLVKRALGIFEKTFGPDHENVGSSLNGLAALYRAQHRYAEAEPLLKRALAIAERALGPEHPRTSAALNNLAQTYSEQGRYADAEPLLKRALAIREKALGPDHPSIGNTLSNLAGIYFVRGDWKIATAYLRQSTDLLIRRSRRGNTIARFGLVGERRSDVEREGYRFQDLIKATYRRVAADKTESSVTAEEMFTIAQWAQTSEAAASLAQMAARQAKGDSALARLTRERQDLVAEWQLYDKALTASRSLPPDKRDSSAESRLSARLAAIDARVAEIDRSFVRDFPEYAALAKPEPLAIMDVQKQLQPDEALLLFLDTAALQPTPEETFIWVVTKSDARWVRSELGTKTLTTIVAALRCGLDRSAWDGDGADRCGRLFKGVYTAGDANGGRPLPFDLARAHELHQALFGQVEEMIKDKHLLVVPSGPLTALPFQILVSKKPEAAIPSDAATYVDAGWLINRHALTVLPSVASLRALREFAKVSNARQPFIGFGNPLLAGPDGNDRRAWERSTCAAPPAPVQITSRSVRSAVPKFFRSGLANVDEVRAQYPLPETVDELCAVAQSSGAAQSAVYLGDKASETTVKLISADGTLAQARVVHFATHGLLAGETAMFAVSKAEPALILTPPRMATEEDDGLLTASEISQLKLDADWVVLSACNTAGGDSDKPGAEALSGLARAFFYAGARTLLVSHWAVNSEATVRLITKAFDELKANPKIGRAEALRRSMLALIGNRGSYAHPANWAPFVVVGEGAR